MTTSQQYQIEGMDCADCARTLENSLARMEGVESVHVEFSTARLELAGVVEPQAIQTRVAALGYRAIPEGDTVVETPRRGVSTVARLGIFARYMAGNRHTALAAIGAILLMLSAPLEWWGEPTTVGWLIFVLHLAIVALAGIPIAVKGVRALLWARRVTIDLLMSIAAAGAFAIGETGEAAAVIVLFAIGEALEGYAAERARDSLRALLALRPATAIVLRPCLDCAEHIGQDGYTGGACPFCGAHELTLPIREIAIGERVLARPGERIPVDGVVASGQSTVNQSPITGESIPVAKTPGDEVFAGSVNGEGSLEITVSRTAQDSTISRIVRLVEQAQAQRAPVERFVDRFAAWYTPAVVLVAGLLAVIPPLLFSQPFFDDGSTRGWLYRALALLIVACPCALVISTPVTMVSALTGLARRGVLVKGGAFLDMLARVQTFAFDKTGTLTRGLPAVTQTQTLACPPEGERCESCDDMLALAATVERRAAHPLAQAIMAEVETRQLAHAYPAAESVLALAGRGVMGVSNGAGVMVGSHGLFHEMNGACEALHGQIATAEAQGQTVMLVGRDDAVLGFVSLADTPRADSRAALGALKAAAPGCRTIMLTGDNAAAAQEIARRVGGIDEVRAGLLPEDKLGAVNALQAQFGRVAMVGDGVNDAPALAAADVGIAMGGAGTAQAMETADIVLMQDDLSRLPDAVRASRKARAIIQQNIAFSLGVKALFLLLTLPGWATLWMAVFADMGASLLVTANGLRMRGPTQRKKTF